MRTRIAVALMGVALVSCPDRAAAQEWARFRGPNGTGVSHAKGIPTKIADADLNWKIELPGSGHSSPVLWGEKIFLTTTGDKSGGISVICLNAKDGAKLWQHDFALTPFARHKFNSFASSTPAVDAERVYVLWNEPEHYMLTALDHTGKEVWQRDLGAFVSQHGCGISPIVYKDKIIVGNEQDDAKQVPGGTRTGESFVLAVETKTGKTIWRTPRTSAVVAYSTPCIYEPKGGKPVAVFTSQGNGMYALDPENGKVVWEYGDAFDKRTVASPLVAGNVIFGSCGQGGGGTFVTAIQADASTTGKPKLAYQIKKSAPYVPTGIAVGNRVWFWNDGGILTCADPATGDIKYQERVGGNYFGSPVWIDGRLFCVSTSGDLVVVEAGDNFNVLHRYALSELCHSSPAVALGRMFVRTENHLWSFGGPKKGLE